MKKYFTLPLFILLSVAAQSQTYVSGFINANTTWNMAGAPYIVTANALVSQGYTLTIDAGVLVKFNTNCALQVDGQLIAIGTAASHITFTSNQPSPKAGDWGKVHIADNSIDAVYDANGHYLSGTILKYCDVFYGGGVSFGEVHIVSASPYISHCNVRYSKAAGIYCGGSTYLLDSSLVSDNIDYGLYFDDFSHFSCGLLIQSDTIRNNSQGGLYLGQSNTTCTTEVSNNYFISNTSNGAINDYASPSNVTIRKNFFINNSTIPNSVSGIVGFQSGSHVKIYENYFSGNVINNGGSGIISFYYGSAQYINIENNTFANNSCLKPGAVLFFNYNYGVNHDTIKCNLFLNNQTTSTLGGVIYFGGYYNASSGRILKNTFDGNYNNSANGFSIFNIAKQTNDTLEFANNTVKNNSAPLGTGCYFIAYLTTNNQLLRINDNEFSNNTAKYVIYLDGVLTNNSNYNFLFLKHNNFLDVNYKIELYNHIPYGSPNVHADTNYWGSTSTQHIDSIIYDYFDTANYSVVYYLPFLTELAVIDTFCSLGFPTTVAAVQKDMDGSKPFPNPFSSYTRIEFAEELKDASLALYNVFGQKVKEIKGLNGRQIVLHRENLPEGIYIYEVMDKQRRISNGKLVVE